MPDHPAAILTSTQRLHAVGSAVATLRQGLPTILGTAVPLAVAAVETMDETGRAALARLTAGPATLLLSPSRAAALLAGALPSGPSAVAFEADGMSLDALHGLADPTLSLMDRPSPFAALPDGAEAALALAVLARLLPAMLVAAAPGRIGVTPGDVLRHAALSAAAVVKVSEAAVPLEDMADARVAAFRAPGAGADQYAILVGRPEAAAAPLVRIHSECFTGDLLGSLRCDCGPQLRGAIQRMAAEGAGALLYLAQEGRGIGMPNKLRAYALQDRGLDTLDANRALGFAADERDFLVAAAMLRQLGLTRIRLLTNNPEKLASLAAQGIEVVGRESLLFAANGVNDRYLQTKATRLGHLPE